MPNAFQRKLRYAVVSANVAGPADYRPAPGNLRPTIQMPCRDIDNNLRDIQMWATQGYMAQPTAVVGNVITFRVLTLNRNAQAGATANHAAHTHDLLVIKNAGAADQVEVGAAVFTSDAAAATVIGGAVTGGVQLNAAVQAHAGVGGALQDVPFGEEILIGSNIAAVSITAAVYARIR